MNLGADIDAVQRRIAAIAGVAGAPGIIPSLGSASPAGERFAALVSANGSAAERLSPSGREAQRLDSGDIEVQHSGPQDIQALIATAASAAGVEPALVRAVSEAESGFNATARSRAGTIGLMQLMPATAQALGVQNPYDPAQNVQGGAHYLHELLDRFAGDVPSAVAAYNAGPGAVERYGGIPPYAETRAYVARVMDLYRNIHRR